MGSAPEWAGELVEVPPEEEVVADRQAGVLGCNSIDIWNLMLEFRHKLRQGLRTCLGTRFLAMG